MPHSPGQPSSNGATLELTERDGYWLLPVRVQPKAKADRVLGVYNGALKVAVTAPPEKGKANAALCKLVAQRLGEPVGKVAVIAGETSRTKKLQVPRRLDKEALQAALLDGT